MRWQEKLRIAKDAAVGDSSLEVVFATRPGADLESLVSLARSGARNSRVAKFTRAA
jgi:hypothetical protein